MAKVGKSEIEAGRCICGARIVKSGRNQHRARQFCSRKCAVDYRRYASRTLFDPRATPPTWSWWVCATRDEFRKRWLAELPRMCGAEWPRYVS